jgi:hypothetical protein
LGEHHDVSPVGEGRVPIEHGEEPYRQHCRRDEAVFHRPAGGHARHIGHPIHVSKQRDPSLDNADHGKDRSELAEEFGDVGFRGESLKVDDAHQEQAIEDTELELY